MIQLWKTFWGKSDLHLDVKDKVKRDLPPIRVDDFLIGDIVPDECDVMVLPKVVNECWETRYQKIFIRPGEYEQAEKSAVAASMQPRLHAFLITGQPGIGLSLFYFIIAGS